MKFKEGLIKKLRIDKNWSQEDLSEHCGLSLRTIQRFERGSNASLESVKILATAFAVTPDQLIEKEHKDKITPIEAVRLGFVEFGNFTGKATRFEYWWFLIFIVLVMAVATIIHEKVGMIVDVILLVPLVSAGARRLNDVGESVWWQLFLLVPFGQIIVLILMAKPGREVKEE